MQLATKLAFATSFSAQCAWQNSQQINLLKVYDLYMEKYIKENVAKTRFSVVAITGVREIKCKPGDLRENHKNPSVNLLYSPPGQLMGCKP